MMMFYPRKVAEKFEADLPPKWYEEATKVPNVGRKRFCPSFMMKFLSDKKVCYNLKKIFFFYMM